MRALILLAVVLVPVLARPRERDSPQPLSPGTVALLLDGKVGPAEQARWAEALADPRAETRAAAARVAGIAGAVGVVPALLKAVQAETDVGAAREEFLALGALAPGAADEALFSVARHLESKLDSALAWSIALRGPDALALATRLHDATKGVDWRRFFSWATREGRESWPSAGEAALALADREPWRGLLALSLDSGRAIDDATLTKALQSSSAVLRTETYWHLLRLLDRDIRPTAAVERALSAAPEAKAEAAGDPMATLAFELLGRALGHSAVDRTTLIEGLSPAERGFFTFEGSVRARLRGPEKAAAAGKLPEGARQGEKEGPKNHDRTSRALRTAPRDRRTRTVSDFPPGLVADVLSAAGCRPTGSSQWVGLDVRSDGTGTRHKIALFHPEDLGSCEKAARVLLLTALVPSDRPPRPNETDVLALYVEPGFLACLAEPPPVAPPAVVGIPKPSTATIEEPRKTKHVSPRYPSAARNERRQGVVVLEATINPSGCIRGVEVLTGPDPDLEGEALRAVTQWRYSPTLLNGVPVPVTMTITVNFRLN